MPVAFTLRSSGKHLITLLFAQGPLNNKKDSGKNHKFWALIMYRQRVVWVKQHSPISVFTEILDKGTITVTLYRNGGRRDQSSARSHEYGTEDLRGRMSWWWAVDHMEMKALGWRYCFKGAMRSVCETQKERGRWRRETRRNHQWQRLKGQRECWRVTTESLIPWCWWGGGQAQT